jgi:transcriptional regulator with XRE-family HTH domain
MIIIVLSEVFIMSSEFGAFLKSLRKDRKMSTHRLAELSGVSQSYITQVENGRKANPPSPEIIKKLAKALNRPPVVLMHKAGYVDSSAVNRSATAGNLLVRLFEGIVILNDEFSVNDEKSQYLLEKLSNLSHEQGFEDVRSFFRNEVLFKLNELESKKDDIDEYERYLEKHKEFFEGLIFLIDEAEKIRNTRGSPFDLLNFLNRSTVTYNGHQLTDQDKRRILDMLKALFPEYAPKE